MKNLRDFKYLKNTRVLLRLDLNVPLKDGFITDETRIIKIIPILKYLIKENAKVIIISHVGRPKGKINPQLSLKPIKENLEKKLSQKIHLISDDLKKIKNTNLFEKLSERIIFFENIRFYKEEENNDLNFSRDLASLADIYMFNDKFKNPKLAFKTLKQASNKGCKSCYSNLAYCYHSGHGTRKNIPMAIKWNELRAKNNEIIAQRNEDINNKILQNIVEEIIANDKQVILVLNTPLKELTSLNENFREVFVSQKSTVKDEIFYVYLYQ